MRAAAQLDVIHIYLKPLARRHKLSRVSACFAHSVMRKTWFMVRKLVGGKLIYWGALFKMREWLCFDLFIMLAVNTAFRDLWLGCIMWIFQCQRDSQSETLLMLGMGLGFVFKENLNPKPWYVCTLLHRALLSVQKTPTGISNHRIHIYIRNII